MYPAWLLLSVTAAVGIAPDIACAIGEWLALEKVPLSPRICIQDGCLFGRDLNGLEGGKYEAYTGIPYAKPPLNELRFRVSKIRFSTMIKICSKNIPNRILCKVSLGVVITMPHGSKADAFKRTIFDQMQ